MQRRETFTLLSMLSLNKFNYCFIHTEKKTRNILLLSTMDSNDEIDLTAGESKKSELKTLYSFNKKL